jgi:hypothetical protein
MAASLGNIPGNAVHFMGLKPMRHMIHPQGFEPGIQEKDLRRASRCGVAGGDGTGIVQHTFIIHV